MTVFMICISLTFVISECIATLHNSHAISGQFKSVDYLWMNQSGYLAAFADINSDKLTDIFLLLAPVPIRGFRQLDIHVAKQKRFEEETFHRVTIFTNFPVPITSVIPGDVNGDLVQDILIYSAEARLLYVYWGSRENTQTFLNFSHFGIVTDVLAEPLLFDFNGDHVIDILTAVGNASERSVLQCVTRSDLIGQCIFGDLNSSEHFQAAPMAFPHSNSFVDLDDDLNADLLISTFYHFEVWIWRGPGIWEKADNRPYPMDKTAHLVGQSTFVDFTSSGKLYHIVQLCDLSCDSVFIWIADTTSDSSTAGAWVKLLQLDHGEKFWKGAYYERTVGAMMALKSADIDQDGYPDFMTIIEVGSARKVLALRNRPCSHRSEGCVGGRYLQKQYDLGDLSRLTDVVNLGFFDLQENGKMDVLISTGDLRKMAWTFQAFQNNFAQDACFLKVLVTSGLCGKRQCYRSKDGPIEYGYNQPGPVARYEIMSSANTARVSAAAQRYQTGGWSLHMPYVLFGLGLSPNFVESIQIRMPGMNRTHQWIQIMPNSQVLVIPHPSRDPSQWQSKLFIRPSKKMLQTAIALCVIVVVNIAVVVFLHMREKKADRIERQQLAHRFNFDAM